jgi:hypothetical protein
LKRGQGKKQLQVGRTDRDETPKTKHQASEKFQIPNTKSQNKLSEQAARRSI